ncbi:MAG: hypothetical protein COB36_07735 [Alphaproteobacteria bacterium]|nr:MAG: hypothetical protein COB36_07735 [Alphaproteobacteria bacterium]
MTFGACTTEGEWGYDGANNAYRYCNGSLYVSMTSSTTAGSCAGVTESALDYDTGLNNFKFCNGTNWIEFSNDSSAGACAVAGRIDYNAPTKDMHACNGTTKNIATETTGDAGSISVTGDVSWSWATGLDSGTYNETHTITVTNNGACDQTITTVAVLPENDCSASPFAFCTGAVEGYKVFTENCTGTLNAAASCTIDVKAQIIIPAGGDSNVPGTLRVITSTITEDTSLSIYGCDGVGVDATLC